MRQECAPTITHRIWIAGDYAAAKDACRKFTMSGLCVAVQSVDYIYTMGAESGVCVTLINYPRFPSKLEQLEHTAIEIGQQLCADLFQGSFTIEGPKTTRWFSRRDQDQHIDQMEQDQ